MTEIRTKLYVSPLCTEMEMNHEGILCSSGLGLGSGHEGIGGNDDEIFNN